MTNQKTSLDMEKTFGENIRELREKIGISIRELAKKVGLSAGYLSQLERNLTIAGLPSEDNIRKLAGVLNTDETLLIYLADKLPSDMTDKLKEGLRKGIIQTSEVYQLLRSVK